MVLQIRTFIAGSVLLSLLLSYSTSQDNSVQIDEVSEEMLPTEDGYYLDPLNEAEFGDSEGTLECPSSNVITTKYKCNVNSKWIDCTRKHCCKDYTFIAGRCVPKEQDPCSLGLCEQQCTVYLQRVICTCYYGYRFSAENQKKGIRPVCIDVNECLDSNGDCEHECINEVGSYRCACKPGFRLRQDNRTCEPENVSGDGSQQAAHRDRCYANCESVLRLHEKLRTLQQKVSALSTAIRLSSFASGPPGPAGPPGPPGPPGPRGFPGIDGTGNLPTGNPDYTYSMLDAFVPLPGDDNAQCRCKRGAQGEPGAPGSIGMKGEQGERGPRGPKGDKDSLDFLLLLLADVRHDIVQLQSRVYDNGEKPPKFDFDAFLQTSRVKDKHRLLKHRKLLLQAHSQPSSMPGLLENKQEITTEVNLESTTLIEELIEEFQGATIPELGEELDYYVASEELSGEDYY